MEIKFIGEAPAIQELFILIKKVCITKTNILIVGESGTGKELIAHLIHETGILKGKPFVPINCGAIPENLMESELFGHKRGSFTGAISDKPGLFEVASGGTLFLDEVGELPVSLQSKLLRALQEKSIRRVGGVDNIKVDVRIIAATNKNLETAIVQGSFREDLYYRLNVIQIKAPPLRHRKEDIPLLAEHFLKKYMEKFGTTITGFQPQVIDVLMNYSWPGNVRELENFIERAFTLESGKKISLGSLPQSVLMQYEESHRTPQTQKKDIEHRELHLPEVDFTKGGIKLDKIIGEIERHYFQEALKYTKNRKNIAAQLLGLSFRNFRYRMAKTGLSK